MGQHSELPELVDRGGTGGHLASLARGLLLLPLMLIAAPLPAQDEKANVDPVERAILDAPIDPTPGEAEEDDPVDIGAIEDEGPRPNALLHVPITGIFPDGVRPDPDLGTLPVGSDQAAFRGMRYFNQFNCVGCHAPNGAGGMGPSLSNTTFKYGGDPENIFLTIVQGRPLGMPAFGGFLPDQTIWDLVAYVREISREETGQWGKTTSLETFDKEQVPAQYMTTIDPWENLQPFSFGRPPFVPVETPEKPE
ncbi:c-type cytochrome [Palleronia sp.]|uniref:c-type cytochrome n=1 Tax=Palleronia sp. TaxID=1940284 RepID=UPI0035C7F2D9